MKLHLFKSTFLSVFAIGISVLLIHCATTPHLIGTWREIGKTATLEFSKDGSFRAVDNQGMAVSGKFALLDDGRVKFEIPHPGSSDEIVILKVSVRGEELTIAGERPGEVERYGRLKQ